MTTPSGTISFQNIETEFGGSHPITMSEYYGKAVGIPASGTISMSQFQNKTAFSAFSDTFTTAGSGTVTIPYGASTVTLSITGAGGPSGSPASYPNQDKHISGGGGGGGGYINWTISVAGYGGNTMSYVVGSGAVYGAPNRDSSVTWLSISPTAFGGSSGGSPYGGSFAGDESPGVGGAGGSTGGNGLSAPIDRYNGSDGSYGDANGGAAPGGYSGGGPGGAGNGGTSPGSYQTGSDPGADGYVQFSWT
jgi:hypothetical protein